ncbi:MAG: TIGR04100 family radical SAM protein [Oscillospiraceae bacterium]|jgi:radical SAM enzyme (TIGR04100 family)|nr:TIGR04100 family radical SAM protein [Oscillospiraceae bacterium]
MADIVYTFRGAVYLNITNRCPCACVFCIRAAGDGLGSAKTLWHTADPTWEDIVRAMEAFDFSPYPEAVFCGYGEPLEALDNCLRTAKYLKEKYPGIRLRINTNGLGDLIHGRPTAGDLTGWIDSVSVSLNAPDAVRYLALTQPSFGVGSYEAMLRFAADCKRLLPEVMFTVVDVLTEEEIARCRVIADSMGIPLRVRACS